jgi:hypothetical protein
MADTPNSNVQVVYLMLSLSVIRWPSTSTGLSPKPQHPRHVLAQYLAHDRVGHPAGRRRQSSDVLSASANAAWITRICSRKHSDVRYADTP